MATPQYGGMLFVGASGKTYSVDLYVSDVNNALINWDGGAGAGSGSPDFWEAPENVILKDYQQVAGTADTEKIRLIAGARPTNHILRYGVHLTSLNQRPSLAIGFTKGTKIRAIQISD